jgi:hypothetical protein
MARTCKQSWRNDCDGNSCGHSAFERSPDRRQPGTQARRPITQRPKRADRAKNSDHARCPSFNTAGDFQGFARSG